MNAPYRYPEAGLRRRLSSLLYESLLLLGVLAGGFMLPYLVVGLAFGVSPQGWFAWLHITMLLGLYFVHYWRRGGQTLAMQTWGIRVVDALEDRPPTFKRACVRYLLSWPSLLFGGAGLVWALFDREHRFLHDRLAGTRIIRIK
ncbi:RDD family protein [Methyloversatilis thermotolerans]|uniref:RDD family protein n=1 Tax=Methyloversatilis thermotolerans TaxID=1346290 RepID=UPI00037FEA8D|nr:RDD family protein [Methyloversatilis thermotolerans]